MPHNLLRALSKHEHQNKIAISLSCGLLLIIGATVYVAHKIYKKLHCKPSVVPNKTTKTTLNDDDDKSSVQTD